MCKGDINRHQPKTMIQPQIDFCCFLLVAINIALTHCYKLVSF